jgi:hypothetical protein
MTHVVLEVAAHAALVARVQRCSRDPNGSPRACASTGPCSRVGDDDVANAALGRAARSGARVVKGRWARRGKRCRNRPRPGIAEKVEAWRCKHAGWVGGWVAPAPPGRWGAVVVVGVVVVVGAAVLVCGGSDNRRHSQVELTHVSPFKVEVRLTLVVTAAPSLRWAGRRWGGWRRWWGGGSCSCHGCVEHRLHCAAKPVDQKLDDKIPGHMVR